MLILCLDKMVHIELLVLLIYEEIQYHRFRKCFTAIMQNYCLDTKALFFSPHYIYFTMTLQKQTTNGRKQITEKVVKKP